MKKEAQQMAENEPQKRKTQEEYDLEAAAFDALCDQAYKALDDLEAATDVYKKSVAQTRHVEEEQVEISINERETRLEAIVNPLIFEQGEQ